MTVKQAEDALDAKAISGFEGRIADMRTRLSICARKLRYSSAAEAQAVIVRSGLPLRSYRCDRCHQFHLTSRTKGKRIPRPVG